MRLSACPHHLKPEPPNGYLATKEGQVIMHHQILHSGRDVVQANSDCCNAHPRPVQIGSYGS